MLAPFLVIGEKLEAIWATAIFYITSFNEWGGALC